MAIQDDWTIDTVNKTIGHTSGATVYPVLELFQWLADEFANSAQMDDDYAFVSDTPQVYKFVNDWSFEAPTTDYHFLSGGSVESSDGNELWSNLYSIGTQVAGTQIYIIQNGTEITPWWSTGNIDILVHVRTGGTLIDGGSVLVMAREFGDEYDHNFSDLSGGGRNPVGINTAVDGNNTTAAATVATWAGDFTVTFGSFSEDLNNGNGSQPYDVKIESATRSESDIYEYTKYITRRGETATLGGVEGQQYRSADTVTPYLDVKKAPFGTIAGGTIFGARGVWYVTLNSNFSLLDANNVLQSPPNYQKVIASHPNLVGCQIFVAQTLAGAVIKDQYTLSSATATTITATASIDISKTPQSGICRFNNTEYTYTSFTGAVFSGVSPNPSAESGDFYTPLLSVTADATSEASDNVIFSGDFEIITSVRKYGFKPYDVVTSFTSTGRAFSPILTVDPQAT